MKNLIANIPSDLKDISDWIIKRALEYHKEETVNSLYRLYSELIESEIMELWEAISNLDEVEIYDAYCDIYWTCHIKNFLSYKLFWVYNKEATTLINMILYMSDRTLLHSCLQEVLKSNYTKPRSYDTSWKVLKWKWYIPPNISAIISQYKEQYKE